MLYGWMDDNTSKWPPVGALQKFKNNVLNNEKAGGSPI